MLGKKIVIPATILPIIIKRIKVSKTLLAKHIRLHGFLLFSTMSNPLYNFKPMNTMAGLGLKVQVFKKVLMFYFVFLRFTSLFVAVYKLIFCGLLSRRAKKTQLFC